MVGKDRKQRARDAAIADIAEAVVQRLHTGDNRAAMPTEPDEPSLLHRLTWTSKKRRQRARDVAIADIAEAVVQRLHTGDNRAAMPTEPDEPSSLHRLTWTSKVWIIVTIIATAIVFAVGMIWWGGVRSQEVRVVLLAVLVPIVATAIAVLVWPPARMTILGTTKRENRAATLKVTGGVLAIVTALIAVYGVLGTMEANSRDNALALLNSHFNEATQSLGSTNAAIRAAGIMELATLANEWLNQMDNDTKQRDSVAREDAQEQAELMINTIVTYARTQIPLVDGTFPPKIDTAADLVKVSALDPGEVSVRNTITHVLQKNLTGTCQWRDWNWTPNMPGYQEVQISLIPNSQTSSAHSYMAAVSPGKWTPYVTDLSNTYFADLDLSTPTQSARPPSPDSLREQAALGLWTNEDFDSSMAETMKSHFPCVDLDDVQNYGQEAQLETPKLNSGSVDSADTVHFDTVTVYGDLDLDYVTVGGSLNLASAKIGGELSLYDTTIGGTTSLMSVKASNIDARSSLVGRDLSFSSATISKSIDIGSSTIGGDVDFYDGTVGYFALGLPFYFFDSLTTVGGSVIVMPSAASGIGVNASVGGDIYMRGVVVSDSVSWSGKVSGSLDMSGAKVSKNIELYGATGGSVYLAGVSAGGNLDLSQANIGGELSMGTYYVDDKQVSPIVGGNLLLFRTTISGRLDLSNVTVENATVLLGSVIGDLGLWQTTFNGSFIGDHAPASICEGSPPVLPTTACGINGADYPVTWTNSRSTLGLLKLTFKDYYGTSDISPVLAPGKTLYVTIDCQVTNKTSGYQTFHDLIKQCS